jgi:hypothetical protein
MSFQYVQPQPEEKKPSSNRGLLIGIAVVVVLCLCLIIGGVLVGPVLAQLQGGSNTGGVVAGDSGAVASDIPTAREAYVPAVTLIRQQDAGAVLVTAAGAWTPVINRAEMEAGRTGWTFYFYLPSTGEMAAVVANRIGADPRILEVQSWLTPPDVMDDQRWEIDSGWGMSKFLPECQSVLNSQSDSEVQAYLSMAAGNRQMLWQYQVLAPDQNVLCSVNVDASTGQIK